MNKGDKVRSIHSSDEGTIVGFKSNKIAEVEIEDGFVVPIAISELVVVSSQENEYSPRTNSSSTSPIKKEAQVEDVNITIDKGIYLGFAVQSRDKINVWIVNNTQSEVLYTLHAKEGNKYSGIAADKIMGSRSKELSQFIHQTGKKYVVTFIKYDSTRLSLPKSIIKEVEVPSFNTIKKAKTTIPFSLIEGTLFNLEEEDKHSITYDAQSIREALMRSPKYIEDQPKDKPASRFNKSVDLHIEKLTKDWELMTNDEMIQLQLSVFETELDRAIQNGTDVITFVHGIGTGTLRHQIHKQLSGHPNIKFFEDANKDKFGGYGATKVTLK